MERHCGRDVAGGVDPDARRMLEDGKKGQVVIDLAPFSRRL